MKIGIVKEISNGENRVALTPEAVKELVTNKHQVFVEIDCGKTSGFNDEQYRLAGASIIKKAKEIWINSEVMVKVCGPIGRELKLIQHNQIIWSFLNLVINPTIARVFLEKNVTSFAAELVSSRGEYPVLFPQEQIKGRHAAFMGALLLERKLKEGKGITPGSLIGNSSKAQFTILGASFAGYEAAKTALALGANVTLMERNDELSDLIEKDVILETLSKAHNSKFEVIKSDYEALIKRVSKADVFICTTLIPGSLASQRISEEMVKSMKENSVIIDVSLDQGPSIDTIDKPTTIAQPTFVKYGVIHYAYDHVPSLTPYSASISLSHANSKYLNLLILNGDIKNNILKHESLLSALSTYESKLTSKIVSSSLNLEYADPKAIIK